MNKKEIEEITQALRSISNAIFPTGVCGETDSSGVGVWSLTEAVMGLTAAMNNIAESVSVLSEVIKDSSANTQVRDATNDN
jgi:hypothetical protein